MGLNVCLLKHKALLLINWILSFDWNRLSPPRMINYPHLCPEQISDVLPEHSGGSKSHLVTQGMHVWGCLVGVRCPKRCSCPSLPTSIQSTIQSGKGALPVPRTPTPSLQIGVWYESSSMGHYQCGLWVRLRSCSHFLPPAQTTVHFTTSVSVLLQWTVQRVGPWKDQSCGEKPPPPLPWSPTPFSLGRWWVLTGERREEGPRGARGEDVATTLGHPYAQLDRAGPVGFCPL